jgi:hypothetical protein
MTRTTSETMNAAASREAEPLPATVSGLFALSRFALFACLLACLLARVLVVGWWFLYLARLLQFPSPSRSHHLRDAISLV